MNEKEMQNYFPTVYPKMFVGKYGGIAVGQGWFNILTTLCQRIQNHIDWKNGEVPQVVVQQVKEKFGSLRFYYQGGDEYIRGLVTMAEGMTGITCEGCGNPGETISGGWIHVACASCEAKRVAERARSDAEWEERKLLKSGFEQ